MYADTLYQCRGPGRERFVYGNHTAQEGDLNRVEPLRNDRGIGICALGDQKEPDPAGPHDAGGVDARVKPACSAQLAVGQRDRQSLGGVAPQGVACCVRGQGLAARRHVHGVREGHPLVDSGGQRRDRERELGDPEAVGGRAERGSAAAREHGGEQRQARGDAGVGARAGGARHAPGTLQALADAAGSGGGRRRRRDAEANILPSTQGDFCRRDAKHQQVGDCVVDAPVEAKTIDGRCAYACEVNVWSRQLEALSCRRHIGELVVRAEGTRVDP
mmetsp:Transcript_81533/g.225811  ORF Transcript_81533/g.225811 Transcript_81533/m.225811 type:complete len:274 (+) Transcript_81533:1009-1830(+)